MGGVVYGRGVGTHSISRMLFGLGGDAVSIAGAVGADDKNLFAGKHRFKILGDRKVLWDSGVMRKGDAARAFDVDLSGLDKVLLLVEEAGGRQSLWLARFDHGLRTEHWRLKVADLARRLGVPEHRLSRLITQGLGERNFNQLVNRHRIAHACRRLADPRDAASILDISLDSGFASLGPFNRAFKAAMGVTPSGYRAACREAAAAEAAEGSPAR